MNLPKSSNSFTQHNAPLVSFEPAELKEWATGWQIEYKIFNPRTLKLEKQRMRFDKLRKKAGSDAKARKQAKEICKEINARLTAGWNPYYINTPLKACHLLRDVFETYLTHKQIDIKNDIFREDSIRVYKSQITMLNCWLKDRNSQEIQVQEFTKELAIDYLDWVYLKKKVSARTWNNYVGFLRTIWNWLIEKNYCAENVFQKIKVKPESEKERNIISKDWDVKIIEDCRANNPNLEIVCALIYNSFMRPKEICRTQLKDIHLDKNGIYLTGKKTKNHHARWCLLPPFLVEKLKKMELDRFPSTHYLISEKLEPGPRQIGTRRLDKHWTKMRKRIGLPLEIKLYSYRDTGITDMKSDGNTNLFISSITGHLNSEEIETYTHEPDPVALQYVIRKAKRLGER
jgi:integrase